MSDPDHWLLRLDAAGWIAAARAELVRGQRQLDAGSQRRVVVTHARRGAGMALNAVLVAWPTDERERVWGRSYLEHLRAVAGDPTGPWTAMDAEAAQRHAMRMLAIPVHAPTLVPLAGRRGAELVELLADATAMVELCERTVQRLSTIARA